MSILSDFVAKYLPDAQAASASTGIDTNVILAQAALESNYGQSAPNNNLFGVKGSGATQSTQEYVNGKWVTTQAQFAGYASPAASFVGYADFINSNQRYSSVASSGGIAAQASALQSAGYATDPNYASKVTSIATKIAGSTIGGGRAILKSALGVVLGNTVSDALAGTGAALTATANAATPSFSLDTALTHPTVMRLVFGLLAFVFIAGALLMLGKSQIPAAVKGAVIP